MTRPFYARMKDWRFLLLTAVIGLVLVSSPIVISHAAGQSPQSATPNLGSECGHWKLVTGTNVVPGNNYLNGVALYFRNDVWAVGYYVNSTGNAQTLAEWRDAHTLHWSVYPSPNPGLNDVLNGLISTASNDFWAVGDSYTTSPTTDSQTLIERWNNFNKGWYIVPSQIGRAHV